jgi:hypothetical protein
MFNGGGSEKVVKVGNEKSFIMQEREKNKKEYKKSLKSASSMEIMWDSD